MYCKLKDSPKKVTRHKLLFYFNTLGSCKFYMPVTQHKMKVNALICCVVNKNTLSSKTSVIVNVTCLCWTVFIDMIDNIDLYDGTLLYLTF